MLWNVRSCNILLLSHSKITSRLWLYCFFHITAYSSIFVPDKWHIHYNRKHWIPINWEKRNVLLFFILSSTFSVLFSVWVLLLALDIQTFQIVCMFLFVVSISEFYLCVTGQLFDWLALHLNDIHICLCSLFWHFFFKYIFYTKKAKTLLSKKMHQRHSPLTVKKILCFYFVHSSYDMKCIAFSYSSQSEFISWLIITLFIYLMLFIFSFISSYREKNCLSYIIDQKQWK